MPKLGYKAEIDGQPVVWLQDFGYCAAKPVQELKPGERRVYNFGSTATIVAVEPVGKMWQVTVDDGRSLHARRHRRGTLIAFAAPEDA
jgi:hypothetical protein